MLIVLTTQSDMFNITLNRSGSLFGKKLVDFVSSSALINA